MKLLIIQKYNKLREEESRKDEIKSIKDRYADESLALKEQSSQELNELKNQYAEGLITKEEYERKSAEITEKYAVEGAKLQIGKV